jgi:hypothetical protein
LVISSAAAITIGLVPSHRDPIHEGRRISAWINELETDREGTQSDACHALCRAGPIAVPRLVRGLHTKDDSRFYFWLWPKLPAFVQQFFERPRQRVTFRNACAYVLGRIEPSSREIVGELQKALSGEEPWLVEFAAQALRMILEREPWRLSEVEPAIPRLRELGAQPGETNFQVRRTLHTVDFLQSTNAPLLSISRDWQMRRSRSSPIRYHLNCKRTWFRGASSPYALLDAEARSAEKSEQEVGASCARIVLLDLQRNRFRIEFDNAEYATESEKLYRIRCIEAGDGTTLRVRVLEDSLPGGTAPGTRVDFWTVTGDRGILPPGIFERGYEPMFFAAGVVPARDIRIRPTALFPTNDIAAFSFGGANIEKGRRCEIIREGRKEYWIDRARDSAIVKMILYREIQPLVTIDITYQHTQAGWLPEKWMRSEYQNGKISMTEEVEVTQIDVDPSIEPPDFILKATAGMRVKEQRFFLDVATDKLRSEEVSYLLDIDGSRLPLSKGSVPMAR